MGTKNLYENRPSPFFLFGTKIWSESNLWQRFCFGMVSTTSKVYLTSLRPYKTILLLL